MYPDPPPRYLGNQLPDPDLDAQFYDGVTLKRFVAWVIDAIIIGILSVLASLVVGVMTLGLGFLLVPLIFVAVTFAYRGLTIATRSATWGMRLVGIELRNRAGNRLEPLQAFLHTAIFMALMATLLGWIITVICILSTHYRQGVPDLILGTTAINVPAD